MVAEAMLKPQPPVATCSKPRTCVHHALLADVTDLCAQVGKLLSTEEAALHDRKRTIAGLWADIDQLRNRFSDKKPVFKIMGLEFPLPENDSLSSAPSSSDSPILSPLSYLPSPLSLADTRDQGIMRAGKEDIGSTLSPSDNTLANMIETAAGEVHLTAGHGSEETVGSENQSRVNQLKRAGGALGRARSLGSMFRRKNRSAQGLPIAPAVQGLGWKFWKDY
ncbi:hypothetical protein HDU88_003533 [Geranomyces variabilis]|nr:hypothetical protein HDU88_003533 [Geranomyces variabilis]